MQMKKIEAYLSDWGFSQDLTKEQANLLTHINYAFGLIVDGCTSVAHLHQLNRLKALKAEFLQLKVNLSIGGWGADGFSQAVSTAQGREKLADSSICVLEELNLSGLDWDWEYPGSDAAGIAWSSDDPGNMTEFLVLMREKLDRLSARTGRQYEQSIAVGGNRTDDYLWNRALPALDTVNLMTYDMGMGNRVGHVTNLRRSSHASYSVEQSVAAFHAAGVPKDKLLIGCALYSHAYHGVQADAPFGAPFREKGHSVPHDCLESDFVQLWDAEAQAGYFMKGDILLSGDDERSLDAKRVYIEKENLGGAILWELNHDRKNLLLPHIGNR